MANAKLKVAASNEIQIDKSVPLPNRKAGRPPGSKYPVAQMQVGDSFLMPPELSESSVRMLPYSPQFKRHGKFSIRKTADGFRCWRVE